MTFCRKPEHFLWNLPFFENCIKSECDGQCDGCSGMANIGGHWHVVMVGYPSINAADVDCPSVTLRTHTRYLPKILVELGLFPSNSAVIRSNKDWKLEWPDDARAFEMIRRAKRGKHKGEYVALIVGPATPPVVRCSKPQRLVGLDWDVACYEDDCPFCLED